VDNPLSPLSIAIGAEATFVARTIDVNVKHLAEMVRRAAGHRGISFVEIYQNCNVFNDGAFEHASSRETKDESTIYLEHGKPMIFGKDRDKGIRLNKELEPEIVKLGGDVREDDLLFHDEKAAEPSLAFMLSRMRYPEYPEPMGVLRAVDAPLFEDGIHAQLRDAEKKMGPGSIEALLGAGDTWVVQ
jgi:2-oxoglutarate ferredoxin oxidoreductase subunit beta